MSTKQASEPISKSLLWTVVVLAGLAGLALWGASGLAWGSQAYETPFTGPTTATATGTQLRPELIPLMLVALAAVVAVLATGGWFRRVIGAVVVLAAFLLLWRLGGWVADGGNVAFAGNVPPGSKPLGEPEWNSFGPWLGIVGAAVFVVAGAMVVLRAHRMPGMGAKYSAPGARKEAVKDPDRRLWEALDEGEDPTAER